MNKAILLLTCPFLLGVYCFQSKGQVSERKKGFGILSMAMIGTLLTGCREKLSPNILFIITDQPSRASIMSGKYATSFFGKYHLGGFMHRNVPASNALVSNIDFLQTMLDLIGASIPSSLDGKSFKHVLQNSETEQRDMLFTSVMGMNFVATSREYKYNLKLVEGKEDEPYDRINDPHEIARKI